MRQKTELSTIPPAFVVVAERDKSTVMFYEDVEEVHREDSTVYTATEWSMTVPRQDGLVNRVSANPQKWLARIKALTAVEEARALAEGKHTAALNDIVERLADIETALCELDERW